MKKFLAFAVTLMVAATLSQAAHAADFSKQIKARKAVMQLYAFNVGQLAAMVKGKMPYDAAAASVAANNLLAAANMKQSAMWPKGSDASAPGLDGKTRAKADIWSQYPKVAEAGKGLVAAATKMAAAAGNGVDGIKANFGAVGGACKACHKPFRAPKK
ncbi:MAG: cytochrome c [Rhodospirillaceae bacterium]|jgi:cytochrome c556|nr:cytochrome c [Rhodospirillaceae bacterium]